MKSFCDSGEKIHALPLPAVAVRFVHRRETPDFDACVRIGVEVPDEVVGVGRLVLRFQGSAGALPVVLGGLRDVPGFDVLHPGRGRPGRGDDLQFPVALRLLDRQRFLDHGQQVVTGLLDPGIVSRVEAGGVRRDGEGRQFLVIRAVGIRVLALHGEIAGPDMGPGQTEIGAGLAVDLLHHVPALLRFQVRQHERRRLRERRPDPFNGLFGAVGVDRDHGARSQARLEGHVLQGGLLGALFGGEQDLTGGQRRQFLFRRCTCSQQQDRNQRGHQTISLPHADAP